MDEEKVQAPQLLSAKVNTEQWLREMGAEEPAALDPAYEAALAVHAFGNLTGAIPAASPEEAKKNIQALKTPEAVQTVSYTHLAMRMIRIFNSPPSRRVQPTRASAYGHPSSRLH